MARAPTRDGARFFRQLDFNLCAPSLPTPSTLYNIQRQLCACAAVIQVTICGCRVTIKEYLLLRAKATIPEARSHVRSPPSIHHETPYLTLSLTSEITLSTFCHITDLFRWIHSGALHHVKSTSIWVWRPTWLWAAVVSLIHSHVAIKLSSETRISFTKSPATFQPWTGRRIQHDRAQCQLPGSRLRWPRVTLSTKYSLHA